MKRKLLTVVISSMLMAPQIGLAGSSTFGGDTSLQQLIERVQNLGSYLGFNLENAPDANYQANANLVTPNDKLERLQNAIVTFLSAVPVALSQNSNANAFFPNANGDIKSAWNAVFSNASIFQSPSIDQQPYQQDPVSQAIVNIIGTPDSSYCINAGSDSQSTCQNTIYQSEVTNYVNGTLPPPQEFYKITNPSVVTDLNMNSLLGPLLYNSESSNSNATSSSQGQQQQGQGLVSNSQLQQAENFIRYASGLVAPINLPNYDAYNKLYSATILDDSQKNNPTALQAQLNAQATLSNYLANLKVYTAQNSIGISNLYYLMAKRLPKSQSSSSSSQALDEFKMASWRLFDSEKGDQKTGWVASLNNASPATIQKEIALLLAEINYQLYLNRMQDERILLTQSVLLLQTARVTTKPNPNLTEVAQ